ncbi:MAG: hypothetical protein ACKVQT_34620 [Burkholderiales bacterium]
MSNTSKPPITGLDGLNPADPLDSARLLGMLVALAGEVFVLKAEVARLTAALKAEGHVDGGALERAAASPELRQWMASEETAFGRALFRSFTHPDEAPDVSRYLDAK